MKKKKKKKKEMSVMSDIDFGVGGGVSPVSNGALSFGFPSPKHGESMYSGGKSMLLQTDDYSFFDRPPPSEGRNRSQSQSELPGPEADVKSMATDTVALDYRALGLGSCSSLASLGTRSVTLPSLLQLSKEEATKDLIEAVGKTGKDRDRDFFRALREGADVNHAKNSYTPLMRAAAGGQVKRVERLIEEGADLFARDRGFGAGKGGPDRGFTALDWARRTGHHEAAKLLERAMENEIKSRRGARLAGLKEADYRARVESNERHAKIMARVVEARDFKEIEKLVKKATLSRKDVANAVAKLKLHPAPDYWIDTAAHGTTALMLASIHNDVRMIRLLLEKGADIKVMAPNGHTALTWAAVGGYEFAVEAMLAASKEPDALLRATSPVDHRMSLHHASYNGHAGVTALLLGKMWDTVVKKRFDDRKKTPRGEDNQSVDARAVSPSRKLRNSGAGAVRPWFERFVDYVEAKDVVGRTAKAWAEVIGHEDVVAVLGEAEARIQRLRDDEEKARHNAEPSKCRHPDCLFIDRRDRIDEHMLRDCRFRKMGCGNCGMFMAAKDLEHHARKDCMLRTVPCSNVNLGCVETMRANEVERHIHETCKYRKVLCRRGCGALVFAGSRDRHEVETCKLSVSACSACDQDVARCNVSEHLAKLCPKRIVKCRVGCGALMAADQRENHETEVCRTPCRFKPQGCKAVIGPADSRRVHELHTCPHRLIPCPNGCGVEGISASLVGLHCTSRQCSKAKVTCSFGCSKTMTVEEARVHEDPEKGDCLERPQRCRLDLLKRKITVRRQPSGECVPAILRAYDRRDGTFVVGYPDGNVKEHLANIEYWFDDKRPLSWACGWIPAGCMDAHLDERCPHGTCKCECGQSVLRNHYAAHKATMCVLRKEECPECGVWVSVDDDEHECGATSEEEDE